MNVADSEVVASVMQMDGYIMTDKLEEADAVFVNTCSIRDNAEQRVIQRLDYFNALKRKKKPNMIIGVLGLYGRTSERRATRQASCRCCSRPRCLPRPA